MATDSKKKWRMGGVDEELENLQASSIHSEYNSEYGISCQWYTVGELVIVNITTNKVTKALPSGWNEFFTGLPYIKNGVQTNIITSLGASLGINLTNVDGVCKVWLLPRTAVNVNDVIHTQLIYLRRTT